MSVKINLSPFIVLLLFILLSPFIPEAQDDSRRSLQTVVAEGKNQPTIWEQLRNQVYIGDDNFIEHVQTKIGSQTNLSEIPTSQRQPLPKPSDYYAIRENTRSEIWQSALACIIQVSAESLMASFIQSERPDTLVMTPLL